MFIPKSHLKSGNQLISFIYNEIDQNVRVHREIIAEISLLQINDNVVDFFEWRERKCKALVTALFNGILDYEDYEYTHNFLLNNLTDENFFLNDHIRNCSDELDRDIELDAEETECEQLFISGNISILSSNEHDLVEKITRLEQDNFYLFTDQDNYTKCLAHVLSHKPKGNKIHNLFMFDELIWLADDFFQERNWKKSLARRLAYSCVKIVRDKKERTAKLERDELQRIRKHCSSVARMVREWWRKIDKIVRAKHQVRIAARRQEVITNHLGKVLQTTEEFTKWLTEDISGSLQSNKFIHNHRESSSNQEDAIAPEKRNMKEQQFFLDNKDNLNNSPENKNYRLLNKTGSLNNENILLTELISRNNSDVNKKSEDISSQYDNFGKGRDISSVDSPNREQRFSQSIETVGKTPFLLHGVLREYQLVGLNWLVTIYTKRLNGILADEMGLGKTIQTISLLAHLACELGIWGPHLIIVPTSVLLNWEMEFKRWCPGFKILTYYGSCKERKEKRKGWTKTNAFHVCITSYRLALQDSAVFKRKKWRYMILDEAQNIKNFKSQRWQILLTFNSQRRLLLTGTPLQNSLMELWSLMHFLMPNIFQSHRDFSEWFASPLTGIIDGSSEYNNKLVNRLHRVLRPFLLRRLKIEVETQMPKKYEHVILCHLSNRQRFLYDDYLSWNSTRKILKSGNFLSVMNILMQLRKVCNHPNLFETRPIKSPYFMSSQICFSIPKLLAESSHPFLIPIARNSLDLFPSGGTNAVCCPILDWLDKAGFIIRCSGQTQNLFEMTRDVSGFVAGRLKKYASRVEDLIEIDKVRIIDSVNYDRKRLTPIREVIGNRIQFPAFLQHKSIIQMDHLCDLNYPSLNQPSKFPLKKSIDSTNRNSMFDNLPAYISQERNVRRTNCLNYIARLNFRRTDLLPSYLNLHSSTIGDCMGGFSWPENYHIGPDTIYFLTKWCNKLRCEEFEDLKDTCIYISWPESRLMCLRALNHEPSKEVCEPSHITNKYQPVIIASRFHGMDEKYNKLRKISGSLIYKQLGPECFSEFRASWNVGSLLLRTILNSPSDFYYSCIATMNIFNMFIPAVLVRRISFETLNLHIFETNIIKSNINSLFRPLLPSICISHQVLGKFHQPITSWIMPIQLAQIWSMRLFKFADSRLIQYDCGKLQRLDKLLRDLKNADHRVLIFTQMTRMLDILEQFLAFHGYSYLRLDGTTKVEQRQVLMERFNQDLKIFVFILSTRSGGLGVNLTGADTVIFYDSDWNPTMDAQAQDRCHRIGQTRDVHIYRLISEKTVEENILSKANKKRFLSDVAIEKGKFNTAFFKHNSLQEIFEGSNEHQDSLGCNYNDYHVAENDICKTQYNHASIETNLSYSCETVISEIQLSSALEQFEDDADRLAANRAIEEAKQDQDEFNEFSTYEDQDKKASKNSIQLVQSLDVENHVTEEEAGICAERELAQFESHLKPIERYGILFSSNNREEESVEEQQEFVNVDIEEQKRSLRLDQMKAIRETDEEKADLVEDEIFYCFGKYDPTERIQESFISEQNIQEQLAPSNRVIGSIGQITHNTHSIERKYSQNVSGYSEEFSSDTDNEELSSNYDKTHFDFLRSHRESLSPCDLNKSLCKHISNPFLPPRKDEHLVDITGAFLDSTSSIKFEKSLDSTIQLSYNVDSDKTNYLFPSKSNAHDNINSRTRIRFQEEDPHAGFHKTRLKRKQEYSVKQACSPKSTSSHDLDQKSRFYSSLHMYGKRMKSNQILIRSAKSPQNSASRILMQAGQSSRPINRLQQRKNSIVPCQLFSPPHPIRFPVHSYRTSCSSDMPLTNILSNDNSPMFIVTSQVKSSFGKAENLKHAQNFPLVTKLSNTMHVIKSFTNESKMRQSCSRFSSNTIASLIPSSNSLNLDTFPRCDESSSIRQNIFQSSYQSKVVQPENRLMTVTGTDSSFLRYKIANKKIVILNSSVHTKTKLLNSFPKSDKTQVAKEDLFKL